MKQSLRDIVDSWRFSRLLLILGVAGPFLCDSARPLAAEIVVGHAEALATLDPGNHRARATETVLRNMFDGLLTRSPDMSVVPEIAESWEQRDPLTYAFRIRGGITFHDGTPLTAADVKFTFERLITEGAVAGKTSPRKGLLGPLQRVSIENDDTVVFTLAEPWPVFLAMLPFQEVVSRSFAQEVGDQGLAQKVNGAGPFRLVERGEGDYILMERFPQYYGGAPDIPPVGPARTETVRFRFMPETADRIGALLSEEVHIVDNLTPATAERLIGKPGVRVVRSNSSRSFFVALDTRRSPFDDVRVRRAVNCATDRTAIIDDLLKGFATPINGVLSPQAFGFNADLPAYGPDVTKAKTLLAEAGYASGLELVFDVESAFVEIAEALAAQFGRVGIDVEVRSFAAGREYAALWRDESAERGHMAFEHWGNGSLDPVGIFDPTLRSGDRGNLNGYSNPEVNDLLDAAGRELMREERMRLYRRAQEIVNRDAPWIFLWVPQEVYGISARLRGWRPSPDGRINLHDAYLK